MRASKSEIYLHFVWTTFGRTPLVAPEIQEAMYTCIVSEAKRLGCWVLAIGGMPDHIHLVVKVPRKVSASKLMQQGKGVSSAFTRDTILRGQMFRWQEGYSVFSISWSHLDRVVSYVENQEHHHSRAKLWPDWEEPNTED